MSSDSLLVFSTGRSPELFAELAAEVPLLRPDVLVCSVGTEILVAGEPLRAWEAHLDGGGWDRARALAAAGRVEGLEPQRASEQRPHKISFKVRGKDGWDKDETVRQLEQTLRKELAATPKDKSDASDGEARKDDDDKSDATAGEPHGRGSSEAAAGGAPSSPPSSVWYRVVYSGGEDLDILPSRASKGHALAFLLDQLEARSGHRPSALASGDSGNDVELFRVPGVFGCAVANAHPELVDFCERNPSDHIVRASRRCAGGIVEALEAKGLLSHAEPRPETVHRRRMLVSLLQQLDDWRSGGRERRSQEAKNALLALIDDDEFSIRTETPNPAASASAPPLALPALDAKRGLAAELERLPPAPGAPPAVLRTWIDGIEETASAPGEWTLACRATAQAFGPGATPDRATARLAATLRELGNDQYLFTRLRFEA